MKTLRQQLEADLALAIAGLKRDPKNRWFWTSLAKSTLALGMELHCFVSRAMVRDLLETTERMIQEGRKNDS
jgi:hypothetical protein